MKILKCGGEGQGSCKRCLDKGKWNVTWMCFLYKIDGLDGCYCSDCVKEIMEERQVKKGGGMEIIIKNVSDDEINILEQKDFDWCLDTLDTRDVVINGNRSYINKVLKALGRDN